MERVILTHCWVSEVAQSCPTLCDPMDCSITRFLCPWDFPGKNTGVGCHFLLQEIFPTQGLNPGLPHCRQTLYRLSQQGSINRHNPDNGNLTISLKFTCKNVKDILFDPECLLQRFDFTKKFTQVQNGLYTKYLYSFILKSKILEISLRFCNSRLRDMTVNTGTWEVLMRGVGGVSWLKPLFLALSFILLK